MIMNDIHIVAVDSRGHSPSDLECYKELTCSREFFEGHIHDNPKNICVKSQVAGLCGLDMKIYFHDHDPYHIHYRDQFRGHVPLSKTNGIATLLTFNPETGYYNHLVRGKAYVLLDDGRVPLSKRQVWGIQELIREAKDLYHKDGHSITDDAHMELQSWCTQYLQGTWAPHGIYETRKGKPHHYQRAESGMSDQATCHHGCTHVHHDGHHKCCHSPEGLEDDEYFEGEHHVVSLAKKENEHPHHHHHPHKHGVCK